MIGRFIIECDPEHLDVAKQAIVFLQENPEQPNVFSKAPHKDVQVVAVRLKKSIRVRQVRP